MTAKHVVNIRNVGVTAHNGSTRVTAAGDTITDPSYSLHWETVQARYHVWLDAPGKARQVVYKNPLRDTPPSAPGYFQTRRLTLKSTVNLRMVGEALRIAREAGLYAKATATAAEAEAKRLAACRVAQEIEDRNDLLRLLHKLAVTNATARKLIVELEPPQEYSGLCCTPPPERDGT